MNNKKVGYDKVQTAKATSIVPSDEEDGHHHPASSKQGAAANGQSPRAAEPASADPSATEPKDLDVVQLVGVNVKLAYKKATDWLEKTSESITIPTDKADSGDLHSYKFKLPLFYTYIASFIVAFIVIFVDSYISATTTEYLSPKNPETPVDLGCKTQKNTISGTYRFDLQLFYEGSLGYNADNGVWEMKLTNFAATYDEWDRLIELFFVDLKRVSDIQEKKRNKEGDFGFDLVLASSYNFIQNSVDGGNIEIYLPANADSVFKPRGSWELLNRGNNMVGVIATKKEDLMPINPLAMDTSFLKNGYVEFVVKSSNDVYIEGTKKFIPPASAILTNNFGYYSSSEGVGITFSFDWRSATTVLAINNGLARVSSLKQRLSGMYIDPYYPSMDEIKCEYSALATNEDKIACLMKITASGSKTPHELFAYPIITERGSFTSTRKNASYDDFSYNPCGGSGNSENKCCWYPSYESKNGDINGYDYYMDAYLYRSDDIKTVNIGFYVQKYYSWGLVNIPQEDYFKTVSATINMAKYFDKSDFNEEQGISEGIFNAWAVETKYCIEHESNCTANGPQPPEDVFDKDTFSTAGERNKFITFLDSAKDMGTETSELIEDMLKSLYEFISKKNEATLPDGCPATGYATFMNTTLWNQVMSIQPSGDDDDVTNDDFESSDGKVAALFTTEHTYIDSIRYDDANTLPLISIKKSLTDLLKFKQKLGNTFNMTPPVALSPAYQTCVKVGAPAVLQALGVAFSNAQLMSNFILMISTILAVKYINNKLVEDKTRMLVSPQKKDTFYKKALSLVCQQLGDRMEKVCPDTASDTELKALLHIVHLYDDMDDEEDLHQNFSGLLKELEDEGVVLTKEILAKARSEKVSKSVKNDGLK